MIILAIATDKPEAEISLYDDTKLLSSEKWVADRQLADTLHLKIEKKLQAINKKWSDIEAIAVFKGPGSFTGLRIGASVANALAYSLNVPVVGVNGKSWQDRGIEELMGGQNDKVVMPEYGARPHITKPKK